MPECYVRGVSIKYLRIPDEVRQECCYTTGDVLCIHCEACANRVRTSGVCLVFVIVHTQVIEMVKEESLARSRGLGGEGSRSH